MRLKQPFLDLNWYLAELADALAAVGKRKTNQSASKPFSTHPHVGTSYRQRHGPSSGSPVRSTVVQIHLLKGKSRKCFTLVASSAKMDPPAAYSLFCFPSLSVTYRSVL